ncbi:malonate decarboxylase holo-ACP synthase [Lysinibacillus sp. SGAir0095]|uniref:malonate decarboxylase holo-ACP synthase n=1 Tax=Lysinibacillus sp. SGAir0095 TaxID=2070463 RepID=UPI0010CD23FE|nr:malonate decarboxylase holo-ACP synthase [Lysinibacillus sp. SGAir0095]QCR31169.1 malonate decarboxylase holo-ACP synthase [Lysinibacillus sp. SGAir0095]
MELNVHDIVQFATINDIENSVNPPKWVKDAAASQKFGVVRRMPIMNSMIPIGLRGETREERYGAFIHQRNILQVISPVSLVDSIENFKEQLYYPSLNKVKEEFEKYNLRWGPTGSVGFEIATSIQVTTPTSDIDICLYLDQLDSELLVKVGNFLEGLDCRIDVQVEIPSIGAFLLNDYLKYEKTGFIIRTKFGPHLCAIVNGQMKLGANS